MASEAVANENSNAKKAMDIMFTQGVPQAEEFLLSLKPPGGDLSVELNCTVAYVRFVKALMTWDEDVIDETLKFVKSVEKAAESQAKGRGPRQEQLEGSIIMSDCVLIRGLLTFTRMTIPSYIKAGFHLRSASKGYQKAMKEVEKLDPKKMANFKTTKKAENVALQEASQHYSSLKASATMGYGLLNLIMSLIPDKILVIVKLFGFSANRQAALKALNFCSDTTDMRSPIAKLVLLWHHTITRPSFGLDGDNISAGIGEAQTIMAEASEVYHDSSLFLYFNGRIAYLKKDSDEAMAAFEHSVSKSLDQREIKHVNLYEIAFINMTNLKWKEAADNFLVLKTETRWSVGYYSYLYGLCLAASGNVDAAAAEMANIPSVIKHKNSNYEKLVLRRSVLHLKMGLKQDDAVFFALQLTYQWSQVCYLNESQCQTLLRAVRDIQPRVASTPLLDAIGLELQGAFLMQIGQYEEAEKCFRRVLEKAKDCVSKKEQQAPAFATYEIGRIYYKRGDVEKAKNALVKAKSNYGDYEVESRLQAKVQSLLQYIKRGGRSETPDDVDGSLPSSPSPGSVSGSEPSSPSAFSDDPVEDGVDS
eukprot:m.6057 g.6057  ORF g.6057 m.6057 type:complete len:590 (+) comp14842_c0_seq1:109-1878(+)